MPFKNNPVLAEEEQTLPGQLDRGRAVVVQKFKQHSAPLRRRQTRRRRRLRAGMPRPRFPFAAEDPGITGAPEGRAALRTAGRRSGKKTEQI